MTWNLVRIDEGGLPESAEAMEEHRCRKIATRMGKEYARQVRG